MFSDVQTCCRRPSVRIQRQSLLTLTEWRRGESRSGAQKLLGEKSENRKRFTPASDLQDVRESRSVMLLSRQRMNSLLHNKNSGLTVGVRRQRRLNVDLAVCVSIAFFSRKKKAILCQNFDTVQLRFAAVSIERRKQHKLRFL